MIVFRIPIYLKLRAHILYCDISIKRVSEPLGFKSNGIYNKRLLCVFWTGILQYCTQFGWITHFGPYVGTIYEILPHFYKILPKIYILP